jgi:2-haloalkanoic acid dehalogenase type II
VSGKTAEHRESLEEKKPMTYRYLTFDCYGTLIDWKAGIERELRRALGNIRIGGLELLARYVTAEKAEESTYKKYREVLRRTAKSLSGALGVQVTDEAASRFAASVPRWPAFPDTAKFLRDMEARGYKTYILSNVDNDLLEETIRRKGLHVDGFFTAEEVGSYKPRPGHWLRFMERTGASQDQVLHVAQSIHHDIIPTQQMGIDSAWVNRYAERLPSGVSPSIISDSLRSLAPLIG